VQSSSKGGERQRGSGKGKGGERAVEKMPLMGAARPSRRGRGEDEDEGKDEMVVVRETRGMKVGGMKMGGMKMGGASRCKFSKVLSTVTLYS
jgi:hypothetical protein